MSRARPPQQRGPPFPPRERAVSGLARRPVLPTAEPRGRTPAGLARYSRKRGAFRFAAGRNPGGTVERAFAPLHPVAAVAG